MADYPLEELKENTLQIAHIPNMDSIASNGVNGQLITIPPDMEPGSDVANMSIMGYNPRNITQGEDPWKQQASVQKWKTMMLPSAAT